jgi:uncharacterized protein YndB with AHSA1/START domain
MLHIAVTILDQGWRENMAVARGVSRAAHVGRASGHDLILTRVFDAQSTSVWKAWTDPEWVKLWWGPKGFTSPACSIDFRVGGKYLFCMKSADGLEFWSTGVYQEIVPLARIIFTDSFANEMGNVVPSTYYGLSSDFPLELHVTLTFQESAGRTAMTLEHVGLPPGEMAELTRDGWNESFDKLAAILAEKELQL